MSKKELNTTQAESTEKTRTKKRFHKFFGMLCLIAFICFTLGACSEDDEIEVSNKSNAKVKVTNVSIGKRASNGQYPVKVTVAASKLADDEIVKMIGIEFGTVKSHPDKRDSRSNVKSATMTIYLHSKSTYYITPFFKTNLTGKEITGEIKSVKTP
ncbi:hypothetical protein [Parabacteroides sp.]